MRATVRPIEALEARVLLSVNVTTYHYDASETGANTNETALTPANVNVNTFGKIVNFPTDGQIYAQPLVMTGVAVPGVGSEDLVYVAIENDSVYAFNAEGTSTTPVWKTSLLQAGETPKSAAATGSTNIAPIIGITGTPVIDPATNTLYAVGSFAESNGTYQQRLYALDIATGAVKDGGPVTIAATVNGTGAGNVGGKITFNPFPENQRPALTLANGQVYIGYSGHGYSAGMFEGWILAYNATTLAQDYVWCNTPDGQYGGIWMSGGGLAVDSSGDLYLTAGDGTFDANTGGPDYAMALVKLSPSLNVLDYFSPYNEASLSNADQDYGCGNAILLPTQSGAAPDEVLTAGKWGGIYLNNSDTGKLGEFTANGPNKDLAESSTGGSLHNTFSYWNGTMYIGADGEPLKAFAVGNATLGATPSSQSTQVFGQVGGNGQGCSPTESSNGTSDGIVWVIDNNAYKDNYTGSGRAIVMAYNANDLSQVLWTSDEAANGRDIAGTAIQFTTPVVANGYVYVGSGTGLTIYGNIPYAPPPPPPPPPPPGSLVGFANFTLNGANGAGIDGSSKNDSNPAGIPALSSNSTLTLTTAATNEASSAFYDVPVNYSNFSVGFTYINTNGSNPPADGFTFTLQNDPRGVHALGGGGGDFGYSNDSYHPATAISPSFAAEFNVVNGSNGGYATDGGARTNSINFGVVNLTSGDPINVTLSYNASAQTLTESLIDTFTSQSFYTTYSNINLSSILSSGTAYVGFTGGTGAGDSQQVLSNFSYYAPPVVTAINPNVGPDAGGTTVTINGSGFNGATAVHFGSATAGSFTVNAAGTQIVAVDPAGSGTVDVTVTTATGISAPTPADQFQYNGEPSHWLAQGSAATWDASTNTLSVTGAATIFADPATDEPNIVAGGSSAKLSINPSSSPTDVHIGSVSLSNGASVIMTSVGAGRSHSNHNVLVIGTAGAASDPTVSIDSSSKLDLEDNDLIIHTGTSDTTGQPELTSLRALVATGRGVTPGSVLSGTWSGNGLTSSAAQFVDAKAGYEQNVLAVVLNSDQILGPLGKWVVGQAAEPLGLHDILIKYTYNGDAALEGYVGDDSVTIVNGLYDAGKSTQADWAFGDFTGNGKVDDNDITILNGLYGNGTAGSGLPQL